MSANSASSGKNSLEPVRFAGQHAPSEQRGDAADHGLVGGLGRAAAARPRRSAVAQVGHEALDRPLEAPVDARARRAGPRPAAGSPARARRARRASAAASPAQTPSAHSLAPLAGAQHLVAQPLDRVVVGGEEALVLARRSGGRSRSWRRPRRPLIADTVVPLEAVARRASRRSRRAGARADARRRTRARDRGDRGAAASCSTKVCQLLQY